MIEKYIGIPFIDKKKDFTGADCYGLVQLYYKNELNIDVPNVSANSNQLKMAYLEYLQNVANHWETIEEPEENCVVAMKTDANNPKLITHFGIIIKVDGRLKILHTFKNTNSHIVELDNPAYKSKIKGFHKWQS